MPDFRDHIKDVLNARIAAGGMSAAAVRVLRDGKLLFEWAGGTRQFDARGGEVTTESVFLIASITKPMVTSVVAKLLESGKIDLDTPVAAHVPEFAANGKHGVTLRHCFTHTSGLTDMVPGDVDLRKANAPLSVYVQAACGSWLLFAPGTDVRYQSSGVLMLSEIAERVTGRQMRDLLEEWVFAPAGMGSTRLGWRSDFASRNVAAKIVHGPGSDEWNHNSGYWRDIGAPWGGVHSTAGEVAQFIQVMLDAGMSHSGQRIFGTGTVRVMLADHTAAAPGLPRPARLREGWGLGWRLVRQGAAGWFGSAAPAGAFGHGGATGTVAWADPRSKVVFVLLTNGTLDDEGTAIAACSNVAATALCG